MVASQVDKSYRMCRHEEMKEFANHLQDVPLTLADRFTFCQAPVNIKKEEVAKAVHKVCVDVCVGVTCVCGCHVCGGGGRGQGH